MVRLWPDSRKLITDAKIRRRGEDLTFPAELQDQLTLPLAFPDPQVQLQLGRRDEMEDPSARAEPHVSLDQLLGEGTQVVRHLVRRHDPGEIEGFVAHRGSFRALV